LRWPGEARVILRTFGWSFAVTVLGLLAAVWYGGWSGLAIAAILIILEVSLSFDNAVVNARVLQRMSPFWQRIFLTIGILIAVFGMRLLFPLVVVGISADLSPLRAWDLAMQQGDPETPGTYGYILNDAHPSIAAFGGMFLLMIFLAWLFEDKEHFWLAPIERHAHRFGTIESAAVLLALAALLTAALSFREHAEAVLIAGVIGVLTYLVVKGLGDLFSDSAASRLEELDEQQASGSGGVVLATGKAAFFLFLYLEVLDASFSFDGVIGAFALSNNMIVIALGLSIGAMFVRSMTIHLVEKGTLAQYRFLEHGAFWAIIVLGAIMLLSARWHIPETITGLFGAILIGLSLWWSVRFNRRNTHGFDREVRGD
jgi:uncharacterized protein